MALQMSQILYTFVYYVQKFPRLLSRKWCKRLHVIQKIFLSLQHFATKLYNTTSKTFFLAVVTPVSLILNV